MGDGYRLAVRTTDIEQTFAKRIDLVIPAKALTEVPLCEGVTHCFVAATITASDTHPVGRLLGDALVLTPSASGRSRSRRIGFDEEYGMTLGGTHHLALLNHPQVYEQLRTWLTP